MLYAWVLIIGLGSKGALAIDGIASEQACKDLAATMYDKESWLAPKTICIRYEKAK